MAPHRDLTITPDRTFGELFGDLSRQTGLLLRQEVELAKAEISEKVSRAGKDFGAMAIGGAVVYAGALAIVAAVALMLIGLGVSPWLALLLVGIGAAFAGYLVIKRGRSDLNRADLAPRRTAQTLKDNVEWAKEQVR